MDVVIPSSCNFFTVALYFRLSKELKGIRIHCLKVRQEVGRVWPCFVLVWLGNLQNMVQPFVSGNSLTDCRNDIEKCSKLK